MVGDVAEEENQSPSEDEVQIDEEWSWRKKQTQKKTLRQAAGYECCDLMRSCYHYQIEHIEKQM
jgi:hypothetical protein